MRKLGEKAILQYSTVQLYPECSTVYSCTAFWVQKSWLVMKLGVLCIVYRDGEGKVTHSASYKYMYMYMYNVHVHVQCT